MSRNIPKEVEMARQRFLIDEDEYDVALEIAEAAVRTLLVFQDDNLKAPVSLEEQSHLVSKVEESVSIALAGSGPYTLGTVRQLNHLHEQAVTNDTGYSLSYMPTRNEFAIQTINPALEQTETKSDSLYAVVMGARKAMLGGE